jgi:hypothetical protein
MQFGTLTVLGELNQADKPEPTNFSKLALHLLAGSSAMRPQAVQNHRQCEITTRFTSGVGRSPAIGA